MDINYSQEEIKGMNIYKKLQAVRFEVQKRNIKPSGVNKFANYKYYELKDISPVINAFLLKYSLTTIITFTNEKAILTLINCDKPDERIEFESPMREIEMKGLNSMQTLGGIQTYQRRYLYMLVFDIVENDIIEWRKAMPVTQEQLNFIKQSMSENIKIYLQKLGVGDIKDLSWTQAEQIIKKLKS